MRNLLARLIKITVITLLLPVVLWVAGFVVFTGAIYLMQAPTDTQDTQLTPKSAIVLTGGTNRVSTGLDLLAEKKISNLLVSGVHKDVEIRDIMTQWGKKGGAPPCCITLGREAGNTIGNAQEAKKWIDHIGAQNIYLITANYHMPRALLEFKHELPGIKIIPYPVQPEHFDPHQDIFWKTDFIEYHKLLMTLFRILVYPDEKQPLPESLSESPTK